MIDTGECRYRSSHFSLRGWLYASKCAAFFLVERAIVILLLGG
ncbi:hypothetical protein OROGR_033192 [Orobanche gracilis]